MTNNRVNLIDVLLVVLALPVWLFLMVIVPQGKAWGDSPHRYFMAPLVLGGVTVALHRLFRNHKHAWPLSALTAGAGLTAILYFAAWMSG